MKLTNWRCVDVASARAACAWGSTVAVIVPPIVSAGADRPRACAGLDGLHENARHRAVQLLAGHADVCGDGRTIAEAGNGGSVAVIGRGLDGNEQIASEVAQERVATLPDG